MMRRRLRPSTAFVLTSLAAVSSTPAIRVSAEAPLRVRAETPLRLEDVLESVERNHPLLIRAQLERERAAAGLLEARGGFDTRLSASGEVTPTAYYDRYTAGLGIEQPTTLWGSQLYAGYRIGRGDFPAHLGGDETNESGELRAGVEIPLLQDGAIDARRTRLRTRELERQAATPTIEIRRIELQRDAAEAYWNWLAMGRNVEIEQQLLDTAEARGEQLAGRVARGALARIHLTDNQRLIVDRRIRLRSAERDALEAAIVLSLHLRDATGRPIVPSRRRLPERFPPETEWSEDRADRDLALAKKAHPILRELGIRRERLEARLALDRNALLPDLRLRVEGSQDVGASSGGIDSKGSFAEDPKDSTEVKAMLRFELPVLQRSARGRVGRARADIARLDQETRYAGDQIEAEIRRAMAALRAAYDQTGLAEQNLALATELQTAEERRFSLGTSNLIDVNIRELQAADAARALIFAQAAYFRAVARYRAAVGVIGSDVGSRGTP